MEKDEGVVTMCLISGIFVIGTLEGEAFLRFPRIWHLINNGKDQQMFPLPGIPLSVNIPSGTFHYPIPREDTKMYDLYEKVTAVHVRGPKKTIIEAEMVKGN